MTHSDGHTLFHLAGRVVVVTGGFGLIGKEIVKAFVAHGASVHIIDVADEKETEINPFYHKGDSTDRASLEAIRDRILAASGRIDVLVTLAALNPKVEKGNTATSSGHSFEDMPVELWNRELAVNLTGTMLACQIFGGAMREGGSIITVSSIYGLVGPDQRIYPEGFIKPATYGVSKGGVIALTKYLATYWGTKGVRVNCVALGGVENSQDAAFTTEYASRTPLRRMARADEYNGTFIYLASDASSYATGAVFVIDGGWTAW